jgi:general secretion pathway protein I
VKKFIRLFTLQLRRNFSGQTQNGFALVEVLVGLAVLSIALLAGLRAIANGADTQLAVSQRTLALWSADNVLMDLRMTRAFPDIGTTVFNCPQGNYVFVCQRKIISSPNPAFRRVEITVYAANPESAQTAAGPRLAWLTTVIPNPASGVM